MTPLPEEVLAAAREAVASLYEKSGYTAPFASQIRSGTADGILAVQAACITAQSIRDAERTSHEAEIEALRRTLAGVRDDAMRADNDLCSAEAKLATAEASVAHLTKLAKELAGKPGEALDDEDLETISVHVRNDQHQRILGLEIWELLRCYRAARDFLQKNGGGDG